MNDYCYHFQCSTRDALGASLDFKTKDVRHVETCTIEDSIVDIDFFRKINFFTPIYIMKIFHTPANTVSWIHQDVTYNGDSIMYAINILLSPGDPGVMEWFHPKELKTFSMDPHGYPCINYKPDEVISLAHSEVISASPTLVRIDKPHRIVTGATPRACVSIRCRHNFNSWEEAVDAYKQAGF
jgi:hypothetical protein